MTRVQLRRTIEHVVIGAQRTENIILIVEAKDLDTWREYVVRVFGDLDPFKGPGKVVVASNAQLRVLHAARVSSMRCSTRIVFFFQGWQHTSNREPCGPSSRERASASARVRTVI